MSMGWQHPCNVQHTHPCSPWRGYAQNPYFLWIFSGEIIMPIPNWGYFVRDYFIWEKFVALESSEKAHYFAKFTDKSCINRILNARVYSGEKLARSFCFKNNNKCNSREPLLKGILSTVDLLVLTSLISCFWYCKQYFLHHKYVQVSLIFAGKARSLPIHWVNHKTPSLHAKH